MSRRGFILTAPCFSWLDKGIHEKGPENQERGTFEVRALWWFFSLVDGTFFPVYQSLYCICNGTAHCLVSGSPHWTCVEQGLHCNIPHACILCINYSGRSICFKLLVTQLYWNIPFFPVLSLNTVVGCSWPVLKQVKSGVAFRSNWPFFARTFFSWECVDHHENTLASQHPRQKGHMWPV